MHATQTTIDLTIQEFSNALAAHVALAASPEPGTVWRLWDTSADVYIVELARDPQDIQDRAIAWGQSGSYDERVIVEVRYAKVGIDPDGDEVESEQDDIDVEAGPEAEEPSCAEDQKHDWQQPEWLGGCVENPGVWNEQGNRIKTVTVCVHCGTYKHYKEGSMPGQYPKEPDMVTFEDADARSERWVAAEADAG